MLLVIQVVQVRMVDLVVDQETKHLIRVQLHQLQKVIQVLLVVLVLPFVVAVVVVQEVLVLWVQVVLVFKYLQHLEILHKR